MNDDIPDPPMFGGSGGSGAGTAGSFSQSGSTNNGGTTPTGGTFNGGGMMTAGTFSTGGFIEGGTFGVGGTPTGGMPGAGTGGAAGGTGGTGGKAGAGGSGGKAGSGGTGGTPPNGNCGQDPLGPKADWEATASVHADNCPTPTDTGAYCGPPERGIDGVANNRYSTGVARTGTEWYQIDFGDTVAVSRIVLNTAPGSTDFTHGYEVKMAATEGAVDGSAVIVSGMGQQGTTTINFPSPKTGQFLRIYQKTAMDGWWSLAEVDVTCQ
jgi:hypothetical protein